MTEDMIDAYEEIITDLEVTPDTARRALGTALEVAIRRFYRTTDCAVDLETGTVNIVFFMPRHRRIIERLCPSPDVLPSDLVPVTRELSQLPNPVKTITRSLFREILGEMKVAADYAAWKKQTCRIIDGVILARQRDRLEVDLRGAVGILKKDRWVPSEISTYRPGNILYFYISAVKRLPTGITIILSRSSIRLPSLVFKYHLPMYRFVCSRRFIGHKSVIHTNAPVRERDVIRVREKVSRELNGEIMELRPFR